MRVLLGMSGGLDSTYAVRKLQEEGHTVEGVILQMHDYTEVAAAREAAAGMGIPLEVVDCRASFEREVVGPFADSYRSGLTPNPCIRCNERVKFATLYRLALQGGYDRFATGHYARILPRGDRLAIASAADPRKDQSYVLYRLPQEVLRMLLLPLGDCIKQDVREQIRAVGLPVAERKESQEICFLPDRSYVEFLEERYGVSPAGDFIEQGSGRVLGQHKGYYRYTVGQRRGLGVSAGERLFVTAIDPQRNTVTLAPASESLASAFRIEEVVCGGLSPAALARAGKGSSFLMRHRYQSPLSEVEVEPIENGLRIRSAQQLRGVAPGQSAVFYDSEGAVLFGGILQAE